MPGSSNTTGRIGDSRRHFGRLALFGPGAARLHEELIFITARWIDPALRKEALSPYARNREDKTLALQYNEYETGGAQHLLYDFLSPELHGLPSSNRKMKFRANRSLRDVEPTVNIWLRTLENVDLEDDSQ